MTRRLQAATATMTAQPLLSKGLRGSRQLRNARGRYLPRCLDAVRAVRRNRRRARMMAFHEGMTPGSSNDGISWPNDGSGPDGKRGSSRDCSTPFAGASVSGVVCSDIGVDFIALTDQRG